MALVAMVLLGVLVFLLTGTKKLFVPRVTLVTYLDDSAALAVGAPVRLNGIVIGDVTRVELSGETAPRRIVRVEMSVDSGSLAAIPVDSEATVSAENVLGTKYINIKKGTSRETIRPGSEVPSKDVSEFDEVVQSGYDVMIAARGLLGRIDRIVSEVETGKGTVGKLLTDDRLYENLASTVGETRKVASAISSGEGTLGRLLYDRALYDELQGSVRRLDQMLADLREGQGTAGRLLKDPSLYEDAKKAVAELRRLSEDLNAGKGTAGKLLKDEELHRRIERTVAQLELALDKVNTGQGTLGQLVNNPSLYESLDGASRELRGLMQDFRANPKKFLRIKVGLF